MQKKMRVLLISNLVGLSLLFTGCGNEERKTFFESGQVKTIGFYDVDQLRQDSFKRFNKKGDLLTDLEYKDNKPVKGFDKKIQKNKLSNGNKENIKIHKKFLLKNI